MKKTTLFLLFVMCALLVNAQTVVFNETCGDEGPTSGTRPSVSNYADWDNAAPVTFTHTTTDFPDVRATSSINTHVWFPANKETDLVISNIQTAGYSDLKLSFEIACNSASGDVGSVTLTCNGAPITVASAPVGKTNTYISSGELSIPNADVTNLRFLYTVANNPANFGYRLDNIKITGTTSAGVANPSAKLSVFYVSGQHLVASEMVDGTVVEIYNALGKKVQTSVLNGGSIVLDNLSKGIHIVRAGAHTQKIVL